MKKITPIILLAIIIPQIAFAAWWNPFSWFNHWGFLRKADNTELLENRVKELEKIIESTSVSTTTATTTNTENKPKSAVPAPASTVVSPQAQESVVSNSQVQANNQTNQYKKLILNKIAEMYAAASTYSNYSDSIISIIEDRNDGLRSLISRNESLARTADDSTLSELVRGFNDLYSGDIETGNIYIQSMLSLKQAFQRMMPLLSSDATKFAQITNISQADFEKNNAEFDYIDREMNNWILKQKTLISEYQSWVKKQNDDYNYFLGLLKIKIDSASSYSYSPPATQYITPTILTVPTFIPPKTTRCSVYTSFSGEGTINCTTY